MDIAKTLTEGGKEVVTALDKRISDVTGVIDTRGAKLAETVGGRSPTSTRRSARARIEVANTLDSRIGQLEQLLVGRAEAVTRKDRDAQPRRRRPAQRPASRSFPPRSRPAPWTVGAHARPASTARTPSARRCGNAETIGAASAATEVLTAAPPRRPSRSTAAPARSSDTIGKSAAAANETIGKTTATADRSSLAKSVVATSEAIGRSAQEAERSLSALSAGVTTALKQNAGDVERTLLGVSAESRRATSSARPTRSTPRWCQRIGEMTRILDEKSSGLIAALVRQERGIRRRGQPRHRPGGEVDRGQELRLHPDDDGQQRGDRPPHQRGEPERHRQR